MSTAEPFKARRWSRSCSPAVSRRAPAISSASAGADGMWSQVYDPFDNAVVSTIVAALPVVVLLGSLAFLKVQAHIAALLGLASALAVAVIAFGMPASLAGATAVYGAA